MGGELRRGIRNHIGPQAQRAERRKRENRGVAEHIRYIRQLPALPDLCTSHTLAYSYFAYSTAFWRLLPIA